MGVYVGCARTLLLRLAAAVTKCAHDACAAAACAAGQTGCNPFGNPSAPTHPSIPDTRSK